MCIAYLSLQCKPEVYLLSNCCDNYCMIPDNIRLYLIPRWPWFPSWRLIKLNGQVTIEINDTTYWMELGPGRMWWRLLGVCQTCFLFHHDTQLDNILLPPSHLGVTRNWITVNGMWQEVFTSLPGLTHQVFPWGPLLSFLPICCLDAVIRMILATMCWT